MKTQTLTLDYNVIRTTYSNWNFVDAASTVLIPYQYIICLQVSCPLGWDLNKIDYSITYNPPLHILN